MKSYLVALALGALSIVGSAAADSPTGMSDTEREAFRAEVRAYLLEHPEVLIEAIETLEARQAEAQAENDTALVAANADALFNDRHSWIGGNPEGKITLVEFMDYKCGFCKRAYGEVEALLEGNDDIRFIVKEFPILGEQSVLASRMAIATQLVAGPEAYKAVHDAMIVYGGDINEATLAGIATRLDLDAEAIMAEMDSDAVEQVLAENHALAQRMQIRGTPTFVLEDQMLRGYVPLADLQMLVEDARAQTN